MAEIVIRPWSVVVAGRWNRAILTPEYIGKELFQLKDLGQMQVDVPLNVVAPMRVRRENLSVRVDDERLYVELANGNYQSLKEAFAVTCRALKALPVTPFVAAGINVAHALKPYDVGKVLVNKEWDRRLVSEGLNTSVWVAGRRVSWHSGWINISVEQVDDAEMVVAMNFEKQSDKGHDLEDWVSVPVEEVEVEANKILRTLQ